MSTVGASNSNNPYAQLQALWQRGQSQSSAAQGDAPSQSFALTSSQKTSVPSAPPAASSERNARDFRRHVPALRAANSANAHCPAGV